MQASKQYAMQVGRGSDTRHGFWESDSCCVLSYFQIHIRIMGKLHLVEQYSTRTVRTYIMSG